MNFPFNNNGFLETVLAGSGILGKVGNFFGNMLGKGAESASSVVGGAIGSKLGDKIQGIPSALSASEQGQQAADYMNAAYPGTTAWDRLGAGGGGSTSATGGQNIEQMKIKNENKMQTRELVTRSQIADRQNLTHLISSAASLGIPAVNELVKTYRGAKTTDYDNPNVQARELLPAKKHQETSAGNLAQSQIGEHQARSDRANETLDAEQHNKYFGSVSSGTASAAKTLGAWKQDWDNQINKFKKNIPHRFKYSPIPVKKSKGASGSW